MKNIKSLSTLLAGIIIGVGISFSPEIYGASAKLLGKEVDKVMEVELNNKNIGQAAVMEGTSYLPVRALANSLDLKIDVTKDKIVLSSPSSEEMTKIAEEEQEKFNQKHLKSNEISSKISTVKASIKYSEDVISKAPFIISEWEIKLNAYKAHPEAYGDRIKEVEAEIAKVNSEVDKAKADLADSQVTLVELEAQLEALK